MAWENHPLPTRSTTPQEILAILGKDYRQGAACGDIFMDLEELTFETTVDRWMNYDEFPNWRRWGEWLNTRFDTHFTPYAWKRVLTPMKKRTLRGVCELIAGRARVPVVAPAMVLGKPCDSAGAFLTLRELLRQRNAHVAELRPSTTVEDFVRSHPVDLLPELVRLRPNGWPALELTWRGHASSTLTFAMFLAGMAVAMLGVILQWMGWEPGCFLSLFGSTSALLGYLGQWFTPDATVERVEFGSLRTFRDICHALTARPCQG
ncbi:MAG: hypothetical protein IT449_02635 [Phycisphaerales bacterium]|nr:hypothetical protein [Phycisphaerales bacterium]